MFGAKRSKPQNRIDCLIGVGTRVEGNILFTGGLRVDGQVRGNIFAEEGKPATLFISEQAKVEGEIRVPHIILNGTVLGPVYSSEYVELGVKASVTGDVHYNTLEMHLGAVLQGRLVHRTEEETADKIVHLKPASGD